MSKKQLSTYDQYVSSLNSKERKRFEEGYKEFLLSEILIAMMKNDEISVRELAKEAELSPTIIQDIRSGKKKNLTLQTFLKILDVLGYNLIIEKEGNKASTTSRFVFNESNSLHSRR